MNLTALPTFSNKPLVKGIDGGWAPVVGPGSTAPVEAAREARGPQLAGILVTHHPAHPVGGSMPRGTVCEDPIS